MAEETVVAESSAAEVSAAEASKFTQFDGWDEDGNPVVSRKSEAKPKEADSASADASKETESETKPEADAGKKPQEKHRKPDAEARIKELAARTKQLERELEEARKLKAPSRETETKSAESSTAKPEAKPAAEPAPTRPKPIQNEKGSDGKPKYASYEDYIEDLADWKAEQRMAAREREQQATQARQALSRQLEEARGRYENFDSVTKPLINEMLKPDIPREVFAVINDSPVLADLLYTIGGTEASKADFLDACRTNPGKALRVALLMEQEITAELAKGKSAGKGGEGKKAGEGESETAPAVLKPRAPKPPAEVGGRGAPGEDALISAAKTGDFRSFEAEQTRRVLASRR